MRKFRLAFTAALSAVAITACQQSPSVAAAGDKPFTVTEVAKFDAPWAMTFLPDGRLLVTEKAGRLKLLDVQTGNAGEIAGVPQVSHGGQGGFGDVILHPGFASNSIVYVSYAEAGSGGAGGVNSSVCASGPVGPCLRMASRSSKERFNPGKRA